MQKKNGSDGKQKWFSFACTKIGVFVSKGENVLHHRPPIKTNCKVKNNVAVRNDGEVEITSICLDHNNAMSPGKARHLRSHKVLDLIVRRRLELNDEAGITLAKSF